MPGFQGKCGTLLFRAMQDPYALPSGKRDVLDLHGPLSKIRNFDGQLSMSITVELEMISFQFLSKRCPNHRTFLVAFSVRIDLPFHAKERQEKPQNAQRLSEPIE